MSVPKLRRPRMNPVLGRELRERMRRGRSLTAVTVFILLLAIVLWAVYTGEKQSAENPFFGGGIAATMSAGVGRQVFEWVLMIMFILLMFMVPALTSGAVSGERERQTLVPLQLTLLRPRQIVTGKLSASVAFLFLLVIASTPLVSFTYLLGGMSFAQVVAGIAVMLFVGGVVAAITVLCSSIFRRTQTATVMSYVAIFVLTAGSVIGWAFFETFSNDGSGSDRPPEWLLVWNPAILVSEVVGTERVSWEQGPWTSVRGILHPEPWEDQFMEVGVGMDIAFDDNGQPILGDPFEEVGDDPFEVPEKDSGFPFWLKSVVALGAVTIACSAAAARRIRIPSRVER